MNDFDDKFDKGDELWELLGKAKKNAVSPLFSRNVLREIRLSQEKAAKNPGVFTWLRNRWLPASVCTLAVIFLSVSTSRIFVQHGKPAPVAVKTQEPSSDASKPDDIEVINHLDELAANEENSIWLEDSFN